MTEADDLRRCPHGHAHVQGCSTSTCRERGWAADELDAKDARIAELEDMYAKARRLLHGQGYSDHEWLGGEPDV